MAVEFIHLCKLANLKLMFLLAFVTYLPALTWGNEEMSTSCPHDVAGMNFVGTKAVNNDCLTIVLPGNLLKLQSAHEKFNLSIEKKKATYCKKMFKNGLLADNAEVTMDGSTLGDYLTNISGASNFSDDAFVCRHKAYANCILKSRPTCTYTKDTGSCYWTFKIDKYAAREEPYGQSCKMENVKSGPCGCDTCSITPWTIWSNFTSNSNVKVHIRYRPFDVKAYHSCLRDTAYCCAEYKAQPNVTVSKIGCLNGGYMVNEANFTCKCSKSYTGAFCEIEIPQAAAQGNIFSRLSMGDSTVLLCIIIITVFLLSFFGIGCVVRCLTPDDQKKEPKVVINFHKESAHSVSSGNFYSDTEELECFEDRPGPSGQRREVKKGHVKSLADTIRKKFSRANERMPSKYSKKNTRSVRSKNLTSERRWKERQPCNIYEY